MYHWDAVREIKVRISSVVGRHLPAGYRNDSSLREELVSVGLLAAAEASRTWNPGRGQSFWRYVERAVLHAVIVHLKAEQGQVVVTYADRCKLQALARVRKQCWEQMATAPSLEDLARLLGQSATQVRELEEIEARTDRCLRLDSPIGEDGGGLAATLRADDRREPLSELLRQEDWDELEQAIRQLPELQRRVFVRRMAGETLDAIAQDEGVSHQAIAQRMSAAIRKLSRALASGRSTHRRPTRRRRA